jgi:hypothetical protein
MMKDTKKVTKRYALSGSLTHDGDSIDFQMDFDTIESANKKAEEHGIAWWNIFDRETNETSHHCR